MESRTKKTTMVTYAVIKDESFTVDKESLTFRLLQLVSRGRAVVRPSCCLC